MNLNHPLSRRQLRNALLSFTSVALLSTVPILAQTPQQSPQQGPGYQHPTSGEQNGALTAGAPGATDVQNSSAQMMDKQFVRKALEGGMAEVQLGQLALQKSNNADVKQFAQRMVDDHTKLGDQLKPIAEQMNVKIPTGPSAKDKATMVKLQALNGDAFDQAYIKDMVKDHEKDQKDFKHESQTAANPDLKQAATQGEQVVSEHLQMIKQIAQKDNVNVASK